MCYYPSMGVLCTTSGRLYACHEALREYMDPGWTATQAENILFNLQGTGPISLLRIRSEMGCTILWVKNLKCITSKLRRIQSAVRDWLHLRKISPRQEAALYLTAILPLDVVDLVVQALQRGSK